MIENSQYLDPEVNIVPEEIQKSKFKKSQNPIRLLSAAADKSEIRLCCAKIQKFTNPKIQKSTSPLRASYQPFQ